MSLPSEHIHEGIPVELKHIFFKWDPQEKMITSSSAPDQLAVGTEKENLPSPYDILLDKLDRLFDKKVYQQDLEFCFQPQTGRWFRAQSCLVTASPGYRQEVVITLSDISDYKKAVERQKIEKNEILNLSKMIIHDIKNPLMTIMNVGRLLEIEGKSENFSNYTTLIADVSKGAMDMTDKVGELLSYISNKETNELVEVALHTELEAFVAQKKDMHPDRTILLEVRDDARTKKVKATRAAIRTVLDQALSNALKFSEPDKPISLTLEHKEDFLIISCTDRGIGIPSLQASQMLNKLPATSRNGLNGEKGYGLGLPIIKKVTENLGGKVTMESEEEQGTTIRIKLPLT